MHIIYIQGYERSGSTLLCNILGQFDRFFSTGEMRHMWQAHQLDKPCGCGRKFSECGLWTSVCTDLIDKGFNPAKKHKSDAYVLLLPILPNSILKWLFRKEIKYQEGYVKSLFKYAKCEKLIDASKSPFYLWLLSCIPEVELSVIHIIRHPKAIEYACQKRKAQGLIRYKSHNYLLNCLKQDFYYFISRWLGKVGRRRVIIKYEDIVSDLEGSLDILFDTLNIVKTSSTLKQDSKTHIQLQYTHTVGGSPSRHNKENVKFEVDETWKLFLDTRISKFYDLFSISKALEYY